MSQNVIKTSDTLTFISKKYLFLMIQDIEKGDSCSKKLSLLEDSLLELKIKYIQTDSLLSIANTKQILCEENNENCEFILDIKDKKIKDQETQIKELKRSRRGVIFAGILAVISVILW